MRYLLNQWLYSWYTMRLEWVEGRLSAIQTTQEELRLQRKHGERLRNVLRGKVMQHASTGRMA